MTSCSTSLYYWGSSANVSGGECSRYEVLSYQYFKKHTPKSVCELLSIYNEMINKPGGSRKTPPPGICAEFGYLLLQPETAQIFTENATHKQKRQLNVSDFNQMGIAMLEKEIELYPESTTFIMPILNRVK
ncbi:MAG: DUF4810 domain-containing protein [Bacteroidales bacterium]|nr:DUF4810 domain-containing protein [Bacteroidales bacterium]